MGPGSFAFGLLQLTLVDTTWRTLSTLTAQPGWSLVNTVERMLADTTRGDPPLFRPDLSAIEEMGIEMQLSIQPALSNPA